MSNCYTFKYIDGSYTYIYIYIGTYTGYNDNIINLGDRQCYCYFLEEEEDLNVVCYCCY